MQTVKHSTGNNLLAYSAALQERHENASCAEERKKKGQVFTPPGVCSFMAGLITKIPDRFRLLDAGAGIGSLAAAVCERMLTLRSPRRIELVVFENDPTLLSLLDENMRHCCKELETVGHDLSYSIRADDFILNTEGLGVQRRLFATEDALEPFDAVIMNPPYFKIGAGSAHALSMSDEFRSQPNIYTMFMARAAELLRPNGELIAITPRSFCNGLYFRDFRRWFFSRMALRHVHLFECRRSTFDNVLQESVITHTQRLGVVSASTTITTSHGKEIPARLKSRESPTSAILDDSTGDMVLRIPVTDEEAFILKLVESWPHRFSELGLRISTGPVVLFRAKQFLLSDLNGTDAAPLLGPHNVKRFETAWPIRKRGKPTAFLVCPASLKHLVPTQNIVLLRRFSAKEERRRLTASSYLRSDETRPYLALENHLNYVYHAERELTADEVIGLTAFFNSALLDKYFRTLSGNTQVNATEIRSIRFPGLEMVKAIGNRLRHLDGYEPSMVDAIVLEALGINGRLGALLMDAAP